VWRTNLTQPPSRKRLQRPSRETFVVRHGASRCPVVQLSFLPPSATSPLNFQCRGPPANVSGGRSATPRSTKLPKAEHDAKEWQAAMLAPLLVAEHDGPTDFARMGVMRALHRQGRNRHLRNAGCAPKPIGSFEGRDLIGCVRLWIAALSRLGSSEIDSYLRKSVE
jgi:hypothetical protein